MRRTSVRVAAVGSAALLSVALIAPATAGAVEGDFAAQADGGQLYLDAVNFNALTGEPPVGSVAQIGLSPTQAQVATSGLGGGALSRGFGQNLDAALLDQGITPPLELSTAEQTAPPDNAEPTVSQLADLGQAAPLLTGAVSESTAWARDPAAVECPDDGRAVVFQGTSTTTNLGLLEIEEGTSLVSVRDPGDATLTSTSGTYVGSAGEVIAESSAQTAAVDVAGELTIEVVNPTLTATATGEPGGASVDYTGEVRVNGEKIAGAQENQISLDALVDVLTPVDEQALNTLFGPVDEQVLSQVESGLQPILDPLGITDLTLPDLVDLINDDTIELDEVAGLQPVVRVTAGQVENAETADDGTRAAGEVKTVRVELNVVSSLADTEVPILTFHLMPLAVDAQAPAGGLDCGGDTPEDRDPFANLSKEASTAVVAPGDTFEYEITVPNDDPTCTVTDVTVTDEVTGPDGFAIVDASDGGTIDGDSVTWELDDLAPGDEATVTLTVETPTDAEDGETFTDEVTATGTCDGATVTGDFLLPDIPAVAGGGIGDTPQDPGDDVNLPRTGGGMALLGLGAMAAAARLRRRI